MTSTQIQPVLPDMTDNEFQRFREFVYAQTHIHCDDVKRPLVREKNPLPHERASALFIPGIFCASDRSCRQYTGIAELHRTHFSRMKPRSFEFGIISAPLRRRIFPEFFQRSPEKTLRIWSAGCSTGQEPYTIALSFLDFLSRTTNPLTPQGLNIDIFATDLSSQVIRKAQQGCYSRKQLEKIPQALLDKYFIPRNYHYQLTDDVKTTSSRLRCRILFAQTHLPRSDFSVFFVGTCLFISIDAHKRP